jgi:hypothetical protein
MLLTVMRIRAPVLLGMRMLTRLQSVVCLNWVGSVVDQILEMDGRVRRLGQAYGAQAVEPTPNGYESIYRIGST